MGAKDARCDGSFKRFSNIAGREVKRKMAKRIHRQEGFTLIELMIVILIIGILVGIAVPVFLAARGGAEEKTCQANRRTVVSAANTYAASEENYPTAMSDLYPSFLDDDFSDSDNGTVGADGEACPTSGATVTWNWDANTPPGPTCSEHGAL